RRLDRGATEEAVTRVQKLRTRRRQPGFRRDAGRWFHQACGMRTRVEPARQLARERGTNRVNLGRLFRFTAADDAVERSDGVCQSERVALGDEGSEAAGNADELPRRSRRSGHAEQMLSDVFEQHDAV